MEIQQRHKQQLQRGRSLGFGCQTATAVAGNFNVSFKKRFENRLHTIYSLCS